MGKPEGSDPSDGELAWDEQGDIYGGTNAGGSQGYGAVYELQKSGNSWTENVITSILGRDGLDPYGLIYDSGSGGLFGTTSVGGDLNHGVVFELTYNGLWQNTRLYSFQDYNDGQYPNGLVIDSSGNLYGTASDGGNGGSGKGTVFELQPSGDSWIFEVLYTFNDGGGPDAPLTIDAAGDLYGTAPYAGANQLGSVFKLTKVGNNWIYTPLHDFSGIDGRVLP
jgi:hypothetical protein